ncbi:MAG: hypothetical protein JSS79_00655 [Bacteroidetes bacterium]|nr:hypothetical protein [Bacteroidota bacterium]
MNRFIKISLVYLALVLVGSSIGMVSCVHELPVPVQETGSGTGTTTGGSSGGGTTIQVVTCSTDTVYFANTILPLINSVCGKSGCHGTTNRNAFSMTTYSSIVRRLGTINSLNNSLKEMASKRNSNYVAPTSDQVAQLQKWINQGAKNNTCNGCDTTKFTYAAVIAPIISTYCKGCHSGTSASAGVDLSSITTIQAELTSNPGRLLGSIQWVSPYTGTKEMPQGGSKLPDCYITQIKKWIAAGAPNN